MDELFNYASELNHLIKQHPLIKEVYLAESKMMADSTFLGLVSRYQESQENYNRLAKANLDTKEAQKKLFHVKSELDNYPLVVAYRQAKKEADELLSQIAHFCFANISQELKIL